MQKAKKTAKKALKTQKRVKSASKKPTKAAYASKRTVNGKSTPKSKNRRVIVINVK